MSNFLGSLHNAQVEIGNCYINGIGVSKDPEQAYQWYKKAASKNNPVAQYNIGLLYYNGWGLKKNIEITASEIVLSHRIALFSRF